MLSWSSTLVVVISELLNSEGQLILLTTASKTFSTLVPSFAEM